MNPSSGATSAAALRELGGIVGLLSALKGGPVDDAVRRRLGEQLDGALPAEVRCYAPSLTPAGGRLYMALDIGNSPTLVQAGGQPGDCGFGRPLAADGGGQFCLYPFGAHDRENIRAFVRNVDPSFLPRPQRAAAAIAAGNRHPELSLPAVFEAFQQILGETGVNLASTVQLSATREMTTHEAIAARDGEDPTAPGHTRVSIRHLYQCGLWAAIRSGYRHGYTAEADHFIVDGADEAAIAPSVERVKEAIFQASGYTKFTTDTSRLFDLQADLRHSSPWSEAEVDELFEKKLDAGERAWVLSEFSRQFDCGDSAYRFEAREIKRLAVKFGPSLKLSEELFDTIAEAKGGQPFDFEPSLDEAETLTTPKELIFCLHWLKQRGRAAQLAAPNLGFKKRQAYPETLEALRHYAAHKMWPKLTPAVEREFDGRPLDELKERVRRLASVARLFDGTLSIHSGSGKQAEVLHCIRAATAGRINYKISGELQLQLFDVLREQPPSSPHRRLFDRMVARCERFAEAGAFGPESKLASRYRKPLGSYLGDALRGRTDGNLFLVFWLGNMVGSRDEDGRYFQEALDELPAEILNETRRRNTAYVKWLAANLI
jgi:hypothetical protein